MYVCKTNHKLIIFNNMKRHLIKWHNHYEMINK